MKSYREIKLRKNDLVMSFLRGLRELEKDEKEIEINTATIFQEERRRSLENIEAELYFSENIERLLGSRIVESYVTYSGEYTNYWTIFDGFSVREMVKDGVIKFTDAFCELGVNLNIYDNSCETFVDFLERMLKAELDESRK